MIYSMTEEKTTYGSTQIIVNHEDAKGNPSMYRVYVREDGGMSIGTVEDSFDFGATWRGEKVRFSIELLPDGQYTSRPYCYRSTESPWDGDYYPKPKTLKDHVLGIAQEIFEAMTPNVSRLAKDAKRRNLESELNREKEKLTAQLKKVHEAEQNLEDFLND